MEETFLEGRGSVEVFCQFMVKERPPPSIRYAF